MKLVMETEGEREREREGGLERSGKVRLFTCMYMPRIAAYTLSYHYCIIVLSNCLWLKTRIA